MSGFAQAVSEGLNGPSGQSPKDRWTWRVPLERANSPGAPARSGATALAMHLTLWVATLLSGFAPAWSAAATVDLGPYLALKPGNVLVYRSKQTIDAHYITEGAEIVAAADFYGVQALQRQWFEQGAAAPYSTEFMTLDATQFCYHGERNAGGDTRFNPPVCIPRQMELGATFTTQTTQTDPNGGQTVRTFNWKVVGLEAVTVPAGTYADTLHVQAGWADAPPLNDDWYANGIGAAKMWAKPGSANDWTSELTDFRAAGTVALTKRGSWWHSGYYHGVVVDGHYAYAATGPTGLYIFDMTNPAAPVRVGSYDTEGWASGVTVAGGYAYVADEDAGLSIINVNNPAAPVRVGGHDTLGTARGVAVSGDYAYVADFSAGIQIINVSNPAAPLWVGGYDTPGGATRPPRLLRRQRQSEIRVIGG